MTDIAALVADNIHIWTGAIQRKSGAGRGGGKRVSLYGIERLRALILDLAVCGKLVPQDAGDEPASKYLLTASQRVNSTSAKTRRKQVLPSPAKNHELPSGWSPTYLGSIVDIVRGITFPGSEKSKTPEFGRVACLRTSNVQDQIEWDDILYIRDKFVSRADQYVRHNDIIISMANSRELVGKVAIVDSEPESPTAFGGFLAAIRAHSVDPRFIMIFLRCPTTKAQLIDDASQTTNIANISLSKLNPLPVPLPPLAEQRRIVAKVDELMALCDALERESRDAIAAHQALVEVLLATLVNSTGADLARQWARLESHFDILFTTDASIDALKHTILDLAVRGKLVEQDARDEDAILLLKRIKAWQTQQVVKKNIRIPRKPLRPVAQDETPIDLPQSWSAVRLGEIIYIQSGDGLTAAQMKLGDVPVFGGNGINGYHDEQNIFRETIVIGRVGFYCGSIHVTPPAAWVTDNAFITRFDESSIHLEFLRLLLSATNLKEDENATAQPVISGSKIYPIIVGLPPLAEQHRIVTKVDALMALCDQLKSCLADSAQTQRHLADAITERVAA